MPVSAGQPKTRRSGGPGLPARSTRAADARRAALAHALRQAITISRKALCNAATAIGFGAASTGRTYIAMYDAPPTLLITKSTRVPAPLFRRAAGLDVNRRLFTAHRDRLLGERSKRPSTYPSGSVGSRRCRRPSAAFGERNSIRNSPLFAGARQNCMKPKTPGEAFQSGGACEVQALCRTALEPASGLRENEERDEDNASRRTDHDHLLSAASLQRFDAISAGRSYDRIRAHRS